MVGLASPRCQMVLKDTVLRTGGLHCGISKYLGRGREEEDAPPQIIVPWGEMPSRLPPPLTQAWVEQGGVKGHEWFCQRHCLEAPQGPLLPGLHHGWLPDPLHGESMGPALYAALSQRGRTSVKPLDPSPCTESGRFLGTVRFFIHISLCLSLYADQG